MRHLIDPRVAAYLDDLVPERSAELLEMEEWARAHDFPIIGPACGHLCYLLARLTGARRIFELGSGYGYSTAFFARAVRENGGGEVHHTVLDEALSARARGHLAALDLADLVRFHVGEAVAALSGTPGPFDLVFNDIDKEGYPGALDAVEGALRRVITSAKPASSTALTSLATCNSMPPLWSLTRRLIQTG
jgi:predicted O-methyltransferase YrrM